MYRSIPHATTGMRPDELFLRRRAQTCFSLLSPNLALRVEECQQKQKVTHDGKRHVQKYGKEEKVLILNKQGKTKPFGTMVQQKIPVTYLVKLGSRKRLFQEALSCGSFAS